MSSRDGKCIFFAFAYFLEYIYRYINEDFKVKSIIRCVSPSPCFQAIIQFGICQLSRLFYWKRIWAQGNHEPKGWEGIRYTFGLSERFSYNLIHKCNATPILFMLRLETIQTESNPLQAIFTKHKILHGSYSEVYIQTVSLYFNIWAIRFLYPILTLLNIINVFLFWNCQRLAVFTVNVRC